MGHKSPLTTCHLTKLLLTNVGHILHRMAHHILCDSCEQGDRLHEEINGVFLLETAFPFSRHDEIYFIKITATSNSQVPAKI